MNQPTLLRLLSDLTADRLALLQRHEAGARVVAHYDFNNTYQYVIAREETHLSWLREALAGLEAPVPPAPAALPVPAVPAGRGAAEAGDFTAVLEDDVRHLAAFVERWTPVVDAMTHARHRTMLRILLGETREHQQLFEQAARGFEDLLGRRTAGASRMGRVLATRWVE
ncbi:MAG: hypothetical protein FJW23_03420 [Acidimicrobiia bacterium]|nr:hypothetical protein [Acidimicrobiia bacterium]